MTNQAEKHTLQAAASWNEMIAKELENPILPNTNQQKTLREIEIQHAKHTAFAIALKKLAAAAENT